MSLRARLLAAAGLVALIALVIADVATYQELRSFLYQRIDQSLLAVEHALRVPPPGGPRGVFPHSPGVAAERVTSPAAASASSASSTPSTPSTSSPSSASTTSSVVPCNDLRGLPIDVVAELAPGSVLEVRSAANAVLCRSVQPQLGSPPAGAPVLPATITGLTPDSADLGIRALYLTATTHSGALSYRMRASTLASGPYAGGQLVVGAPLGSTASTLNRLLVVELAVTGAALLAALLLGWWLVRLGLGPLRSIETTAEAIARGELAQRVPGEGAKTEVGRLARALNVMLGRIERAFAQRDATERELRESESRMRRFVADASHELRTPLTAVSAYAELFEQGASARADDLQRVMHGIRSETGRMGHLVEDLLLLARLDEGRPLEQEDVELVAIVADAVRTATTVGPTWPVRLVAHEPVEVTGDGLRLRQVVDNLLSNVRTHCPQGTTSVVTVARDDHDATITVADDGPGIDADQAARVFERFFRVDASRSREHGGSGLGLAIVASIVAAHGGTVSAAPGPGGGAHFTLRLPLATPHEVDAGAEPRPAPGLTADS
jgi:two-component system OmpR family sensor kinase